MTSPKEIVKDFWERNPCGARDVACLEKGSTEFFETVERQRFQGDEYMFDVVQFDRWKDKKVLEVGCGLGTDLFQFARAKAEVYGVDLTKKGVTLTRKRLALSGLQGLLCIGDAESLPFPTNYFDLVYCWGVIHHTPNPLLAVQEIVRVCKPRGSILAMVYNRHSLFAAQAWLYYGFLRGKPWRLPAQIIEAPVESPGTKAFSRDEARALFEGLQDIQVKAITTRYDTRVGRRLFLPRWVRKLVPSHWGWFLVIRGHKPCELSTPA